MASSCSSPLLTLRQAKGFTLPTVAAAIGCNKGHLSRIERGLVRPRVEIQNRIVEFFDGAITRDQIANPEEYIAGEGRKPVRAARAEAGA